STLLASADSNGSPANGGATGVAVSANGRFVSFVGSFPSFPGAPNGGAFVRDTCIGAFMACTPSTRIVSVDNAGNPAGTGTFDGITSISDDGRFVAFTSRDVLAAGASPAFANVYVHDTCRTEDGPVASCTESTVTASVASDGSTPNNVLD